MDTTLIDTKEDLPIWQGLDTPLYVTDIIQETNDVYTFRFQGDPLCRFVYRPGQFCTLALDINGKKVRRSYTISSTPSRPFVLEITVKRVPGGLVSNWLPDNLKIGDKVEIAGPKGKFCFIPGKIPPKILFIAAGSGVTPLMSMAQWLCDVSANVDIHFFNSARTPDDIIFRNGIEFLTSRYKMFEPVIITSTRGSGMAWTGLTGRISREMLEMVAPDIHERHIYMCGPPGFMEAVKKILAEPILGQPFNLSNLHTESFSGIRTATEEKSALVAGTADTSPAPTMQEEKEPTASLTVEFARSGKKVSTDGKTPLLDIAEEQDIDLDYGCRSGSCGLCKARLLKGDVDMEDEEGLEPEEKDDGYILTCVATPLTDCTLDV
ncbi:MAG: hybrid-cluster NAD(P)-dependent oxidoreductase [Deltaproteobacteria bacterium]|nr:hybrid-cluster NAD(P)-dependent oxidoreductase [Deltaproteobacteria bacterium]